MKNAVPALLLACLFRAAALEAQPLARWTFDELSGKTLRDQVGNCNGELKGEAEGELLKPGILGKVLCLDSGLLSVVIPHAATVDLINDFTIECLVRPDDVRGYRTIVWKGDRAAQPERVQYYLNLRDGKLEFKAKKADGGWVSWMTKEACTRDSAWAFIQGRDAAANRTLDIDFVKSWQERVPFSGNAFTT